MLRIALIAPPYESVPPRLYGGTERVVDNLATGLTRAGLDVTVFATGDSTPSGWRLVPVVDEALRLKKPPVADAAAYQFKMLAEVQRFAGEFDVIHNNNDYWFLPLAHMTRTPVLTTVHNRIDVAGIADAFEGFAHNHFISISDSQRRSLPSLNWMRTIYHGIGIEHLRYNAGPGKYLAFLGRIHGDKKPEWAIEIAKRAGLPLKIAAKIEGREGQAYYDALIRPHVDGRMIEYVGEISESEKSDFLGNALALVFPIDWPEPFGLVMIEAMACGTPVLARPCGSVPEIVRDGVTGYCRLDLDVLAAHARNLGQIDRARCRAWVEERFSLARMTEDYIHVYQQLTDRSVPRGANRLSFRRRANRYRRNLVHSVERAADGNS